MVVQTRASADFLHVSSRRETQPHVRRVEDLRDVLAIPSVGLGDIEHVVLKVGNSRNRARGVGAKGMRISAAPDLWSGAGGEAAGG